MRRVEPGRRGASGQRYPDRGDGRRRGRPLLVPGADGQPAGGGGARRRRGAGRGQPHRCGRRHGAGGSARGGAAGCRRGRAQRRRRSAVALAPGVGRDHRHPRPERPQACVGGDRRRRPSPAGVRPARQRQDHGRTAPGGPVAPAAAARGAGGDADPLGGRQLAGGCRPVALAAVSRAASQRVTGGDRRRRTPAAARRGVAGPPRRSAAGRGAGILAPASAVPARAAGNRVRQRGARRPDRELPLLLPTGDDRQPVPVRQPGGGGAAATPPASAPPPRSSTTGSGSAARCSTASTFASR